MTLVGVRVATILVSSNPAPSQQLAILLRASLAPAKAREHLEIEELAEEGIVTARDHHL